MLLQVTHGSAFCSQQASYVRVGVWLTVVKEIHADISHACVARLCKYKPDEYELIIAHFVIGISLRSIAKRRRCSDGTIRKQLQTALGFINGVMYMLK